MATLWIHVRGCAPRLMATGSRSDCGRASLVIMDECKRNGGQVAKTSSALSWEAVAIVGGRLTPWVTAWIDPSADMLAETLIPEAFRSPDGFREPSRAS